MIFHKSLSKKKGAAYSFFSGLSASMVPAIFIAIFGTVIMAVLPLIEFIGINTNAQDSLSETVKKAKDIFKFSVFGSRDFLDTVMFYMILAVLGVFSILVAVRIFSFICDKKTVNVYYSLGIKRSSLFMSKYFAGAVLLCAATAIPTVLSYFVNVIYLGPSWQLSLVLLHLYCGLSVFMLLCYSITAAVFSSVGTVSEAVVYSVAVLFAPTIIIFITEQIIGAFLPSSTLNEYLAHFGDDPYMYYSGSSSLLEATAAFNPVLFFADELLKYSCGLIDGTKIELMGIDSEWIFPNILIHFPWFIIAVAAGVIGALLFKRIKAENCGFLNTNKLLSNLTIFELCLFGSSIFLSEIRWEGPAVVLSIGAVAAFVLYIIAEIFLKRNFKKIVFSLYKFVAHMAVIAIIFGICATGAFGYDTYIPDKSKIKSAEVAVPFSYSGISTYYMGYGWNSDAFIRIYEPYHMMYMPVFTESGDIDTVMEVNKLIHENENDDGSFCQIVIRYNYHSGSFSERKIVLRNKDEIASLFSLYDTKAYKEELKNLFYKENRVDEIKKAALNNYYVDESIIKQLAFEYEYSSVSARTPSLHESRALDLTKEEFTALKDAVFKDLSAQSSSEYFSSDFKQLGVLSFDVNEKAYKIEGLNGYTEEAVTMPTIPEAEVIPEDIPEETLPEVIITEEVPEEDSPYLYTSNELYSALGGLDYNGSYDVIITENMINTLSVLEKAGLTDCFKTELTVESVSFREYNSGEIFNYYYNNSETNYLHDFFAYAVNPMEFYDIENEPNFKLEGNYSENIITDKEKLTQLDSLMRLHEYTFDSGYFCLVKYTNGEYTVRYLSEEDAPQYVRDFNYTMNENPTYYY
ncbi:MAG: ABC transporter permease [Clostridia bacterium]|nr:ABC transporter permease [Clostridia bacterium]